MSEFEFIHSLKDLISFEGSQKNLYPDARNFEDDICILAELPYGFLISSQDSITESIHFFPNDPLDLIIKKAIRTNISDIACKGAKPWGIMISLCLPPKYHTNQNLAVIKQALQEDLFYYNLKLLGGDTTSAQVLTISVTIFGICDHLPADRRQAKIGDQIYVTGTLGLSKIGLDLKLEEIQDSDILQNRSFYEQAYLVPKPPLDLGIALCQHMNASMDISDGLLTDLEKITHASHVGYHLYDDQIPCADIINKSYARECALYGGDDYQILFTSQTDQSILYSIAKAHHIQLSCIGKINREQENKKINIKNFKHF